ncbi:MAG TPA: cytochrome C oxidase subunit IV family protein [Anaerolineales bacterium]|nr:cytochrome C oxidase subunit IV family protein [Anaerolineales bacterium]
MQREAAARPNYFIVFAVLAIFTLVETLVSYVHQQAIKVPVLIGLAVIKAVLVLLYFMHLRSDARVFSYLFVAGCVLAVPLILVITVVMPALLAPHVGGQ